MTSELTVGRMDNLQSKIKNLKCMCRTAYSAVTFVTSRLPFT